MIVSEKRFKKVNVQRPAVAISLGEQIRLGKQKPMQPANLPSSEEVEINPLRNANNMTRLSAAVTAYDRLAERQLDSEPTPEPTPEPSPSTENVEKE